tara:strand:+ start:900 stop:1886 length:987 start_codon:yes stop_codon:yes gene_type:complete
MKKIKFRNTVNLAEPKFGSKIIYKTDQFFGAANRILNSQKPIFKEGVYDNHGKWMDGWETRRKRGNGHDSLIIKLGRPGKIFDVDIDTSFFSGNQPSQASLQACFSEKNPTKNTIWKTILKKKKLGPNQNHNFKIKNHSTFNFVKFNIFPDGGVARLKLNGKVDLEKINLKGKNVNLSSILNGSTIVGCNNEHFGKAENVLSPGAGYNMGDGWETRRSRGKNFDWIIIKFGIPGIINKLEIDTHHFKGNYPDSLTVQSALISNKVKSKKILNDSKKWKILLGKTKLKPHKKHLFKTNTNKKNKVNCLRINIYPDGGLSRIRAFGKVVK